MDRIVTSEQPVVRPATGGLVATNLRWRYRMALSKSPYLQYIGRGEY
jgi:hypothetical protein